MNQGYTPHIIKEGSREHVIYWDSSGSHCSEPNCEWNQPIIKTDDNDNDNDKLKFGIHIHEVIELLHEWKNTMGRLKKRDYDYLCAKTNKLLGE